DRDVLRMRRPPPTVIDDERHGVNARPDENMLGRRSAGPATVAKCPMVAELGLIARRRRAIRGELHRFARLSGGQRVEAGSQYLFVGLVGLENLPEQNPRVDLDAAQPAAVHHLAAQTK